MCKQEKSETNRIKYKHLFNFLLHDNENLLSFLCGIFSNIPISLLFTVNTYGKNCFAHAYFFVWIGAFVFSVVITICAFAITLKKMGIKKELEIYPVVAKKEDELEEKLNDKATRHYFYLRFWLFVFFMFLLVCSAITLWALYSKAIY